MNGMRNRIASNLLGITLSTFGLDPVLRTSSPQIRSSHSMSRGSGATGKKKVRKGKMPLTYEENKTLQSLPFGRVKKKYVKVLKTKYGLI